LIDILAFVDAFTMILLVIAVIAILCFLSRLVSLSTHVISVSFNVCITCLSAKNGDSPFASASIACHF